MDLLLRLFLLLIVSTFWSQGGLAASIIKNGDFTQIDDSGNPRGWSCVCQSRPVRCDLKHDTHSKSMLLTLQPGCSLASDSLGLANQRLGIRMETAVTNTPSHFQDFSLNTFGDRFSSRFGVTESVHPIEIVKTPADICLRSTLASSDHVGSIWIYINNTQAKPIEIKRIDAFQEEPNPTAKSGALLKATHLTALQILSKPTTKEIWMPLPLDYASQVPLWIDVKAEPSSAINSIRYTQDFVGNLGVIVSLKDGIAEGTRVDLKWEGIVLTRVINESEYPEVYAAQIDPATWLRSTSIVQAGYTGIAQTALSITADAASDSEKMKSIISWTSKNIGPYAVGSLDAAHTFETRNASCTGFANLASAFGRAANVPTRSIANYAVGWAQFTHYINEFYLGPHFGWRRVEPQSSLPFVNEDYGLMVRIIVPEDEGEQAFHHWAVPGVPYLSLVENLNAPEAQAKFLHDPITFPDCASCMPDDCPSCDNRAEHWIDLRGTHDEMKALFEKARVHWQQDLHAYLSQGKIDPKRQGVRAQVAWVQDIADLKKILNQLD